MIGMHLEVKRAFFDTKKVQGILDKKARSALSRAGAMIRRTAQQSMRTSKKPSRPFSPPHARNRKLLKKMLFFAYDERAKSVVIGPVLLQRTKERKVPGLIERGGERLARKRGGGFVVQNYLPRPFMAPAFAANTGKIADLFASRGLV